MADERFKSLKRLFAQQENMNSAKQGLSRQEEERQVMEEANTRRIKETLEAKRRAEGEGNAFGLMLGLEKLLRDVNTGVFDGKGKVLRKNGWRDRHTWFTKPYGLSGLDDINNDVQEKVEVAIDHTKERVNAVAMGVAGVDVYGEVVLERVEWRDRSFPYRFEAKMGGDNIFFADLIGRSSSDILKEFQDVLVEKLKNKFSN